MNDSPVPLPPSVAADDVALNALAYAHERGGVAIRPDDQGTIKGNAVMAMEQQIDRQLDQLRQQAETLARQAQALKVRQEISYRIYQTELRFDPIINKIYHLYERDNGTWWLSLISPEEWGGRMKHVATVRLLADHTWEVIDCSPTTFGDK
jgi:Protein of unknown function (DUF2452)